MNIWGTPTQPSCCDRLQEANLKLKPQKCTFTKKQVAFLGHAVSPAEIAPMLAFPDYSKPVILDTTPVI